MDWFDALVHKEPAFGVAFGKAGTAQLGLGGFTQNVRCNGFCRIARHAGKMFFAIYHSRVAVPAAKQRTVFFLTLSPNAFGKVLEPGLVLK